MLKKKYKMFIEIPVLVIIKKCIPGCITELDCHLTF